MEGEATKLAQNLEGKKSLPPLLHREFVTVGQDDGETIRVMQWNMLAQAMSGVDNNFIMCPPDAVKWENRQVHIVEEILQYKPTILCMEEVDRFEFLLDKLSGHGYLGIFYPKPSSPCLEYDNNTGPDGCALFYDTTKLLMMQSKSLILQDKEKEDTNQVCIIAQLQTKSSNPKNVNVVVTHLKSSKSFHKLREDQGKCLLRYISETDMEGPLIVCGDFNGSPDEAVYKVMTSSDLELQSVNTFLSPEKFEPKFTTYKVRPNGRICHTIDYIFCSQVGLTVKAILALPTEADLGENALPSWNYPSDHLSISADFCLQ